MKPQWFTALALCVLGYADPAAAQAPTPSPWMVSVTFGPRYHFDGSRAAFSREEVGFAGGVLLGRTLTPASLPVELAVELGFESERNTGELRRAFTTRVNSLAPSLGVSLRWRALRWLLPFARIHAGATRHEVSLETQGGDDALSGGAWTFQGSAGLGLMFQTGTFSDAGFFRSTRFVFTLEGGVAYTMPAEIAVTPRVTDERLAQDRIATTAVRLGDLDTSAGYLRFGLGLRF